MTVVSAQVERRLGWCRDAEFAESVVDRTLAELYRIDVEGRRCYHLYEGTEAAERLAELEAEGADPYVLQKITNNVSGYGGLLIEAWIEEVPVRPIAGPESRIPSQPA